MSTWRRIRLAALRARVETGIEADGHRDWVNGLVVSLIEELEREDDELFALRDKLQQTKTQLASCSVAALGWSEPGEESKLGDYGWSESYSDVRKLRLAYETMTAERDKESAECAARKERYGNAESRGRSGDEGETERRLLQRARE